jgi:hypothetical protein
MTERTWRAGVLSLLGAWALTGCGGPPPPPADAGLQGTWRVTTTAGDLEFFGSDGPVTLAFAGADVGTVEVRALREASGAVACGTLVFAVDGGELLLSSPRWFDATFALVEVDDDTVTLANADVTATLTRVAGAGPVPACATATTRIEATLPFEASSFGTVAAHGTTLYLNVADDPGTIVGYDVPTGTLGAGRTLTVVDSGGLHRWLVGARDASRFYGHCGCGGSTTLNAFDLDLDVVLASLDAEAAALVPFSIDFGEFDDGLLLIGGDTRDGTNANHLAEVDPDTLALSNERDVLEDLNLIDVAIDDGVLYGLVHLAGGPALVGIDADGRATATFPLPELADLQLIGTAAIDGVLYVAASDYETGTTILLAVELP